MWGRRTAAVRARPRPRTGGTLDKLETIPGFRVALSTAEFIAQLRDVGAVVCAAGEGAGSRPTGSSTPCATSPQRSSRSRDRRFDHEQEKIAEGTGALVLDVKVGTGAFAKNRGGRADWPAPWSRLGTARA
jgi:thymidine phosphorylase